MVLGILVSSSVVSGTDVVISSVVASAVVSAGASVAGDCVSDAVVSAGVALLQDTKSEQRRENNKSAMVNLIFILLPSLFVLMLL